MQDRLRESGIRSSPSRLGHGLILAHCPVTIHRMTSRLATCLLVFTLSAIARSEGPSFDTQIAPLLARRCLGCHNASDKKGGLDLTSHAASDKGGENGQVIEPGKPEESSLWQRVQADEMPPKTPLPDAEKQ